MNEQINLFINLFSDAHTHIFLDLMDASEANAVYDLKRILENMEEAHKLIQEVDKLEKDLRFYGTQLRDGSCYLF